VTLRGGEQRNNNTTHTKGADSWVSMTWYFCDSYVGLNYTWKGAA